MQPNNLILPEHESRTLPVPELRIAGTEAQPVIEGYAAVFRVRSEDLGGFVEEIQPGFFADCLDMDVRALFNHDNNFVLGRTKSGTLSLAEDGTGLAMSCQAPVTGMVNDLVLAPMRRGDINQMSFSFDVMEGGDFWHMEGDQVVRTLLPGGCERLYDVSLVTYPAYPQTSAVVRSKALALRQNPAGLQDQQARNLNEAVALLQKQTEARRRRLDILEKSVYQK